MDNQSNRRNDGNNKSNRADLHDNDPCSITDTPEYKQSGGIRFTENVKVSEHDFENPFVREQRLTNARILAQNPIDRYKVPGRYDSDPIPVPKKAANKIIKVPSKNGNYFLSKAVEMFKNRSTVTEKVETLATMVHIAFLLFVITAGWYVFYYCPMVLAEQKEEYISSKEKFMRTYIQRDDFAFNWRKVADERDTALAKESLSFIEHLQCSHVAAFNPEAASICTQMAMNVTNNFEKRRKDLKMSVQEIKERIPFSLTSDQKSVWNTVDALYSGNFESDLDIVKQQAEEKVRVLDPVFIFRRMLHVLNEFTVKMTWSVTFLLGIVALIFLIYAITPLLTVIKEIILVTVLGIYHVYSLLCCKRT